MPGFLPATVVDVLFQDNDRMTACYAESLRTTEAADLLGYLYGPAEAFTPPKKSLRQAEAELLHVGFHPTLVRNLVDTWMEISRGYAVGLEHSSVFGKSYDAFFNFKAAAVHTPLRIIEDPQCFLGYKTLSFDGVSLLQDNYYREQMRLLLLTTIEDRFRPVHDDDQQRTVLWTCPEAPAFRL